MKIVPLLLEAKKGNNEAFQQIVEQYKSFIWFEIHKYGIHNKVDCYDEVTRNLLKVVIFFNPHAHF